MASSRDQTVKRSGLEELVVRRTHGKNLSVIMGDVLFKDLITCIQELVANSYDADAERVDIIYDPEKKAMSVTDDGIGMDFGGLNSFYGMGDSPKLHNNTTKKGRRMIGKFGIASLVLRTLARHYVLVTERDGVQYKVEETLSDDDDDTKPITVKKNKKDDVYHGTKIYIEKLRFLEDGRDIDLKILRRRLSVEMPVSPDFAIWLNRDEVKPRVVESGIEYLVDIDDPLIGNVNGSIWYSPKLGEESAGIYIKVHGKAVGGTNAELLGGKLALLNRVFGIINADGLDRIVAFDRDNFIKDHPKIKKLRVYLNDILKQIGQDIGMEAKNSEIKKARKTVESLKPDIGEFVGIIMGTGEYEVVIDSSMSKSDPPTRLDADERKLYINRHSDHFSFGRYAKPDLILKRFYEAARRAILREIVPDSSSKILRRLEEAESESHTEELKKFETQKKKNISLNDIISDSEDKEIIYRISPARLYTESEIARVSDLNIPILQRAIGSNILGYRKDKILGQDVLNLLDRIKGHVALFEAIRRAYPENNPGNYSNIEDRTCIKLNEVAKGRELPHWIKNLAENGRSFYIIRENDLDSFKYFVDRGEFLGKSNIIGERFYHYRDLSTKKGESKGVVIYIVDILAGSYDVIREVVRHETEFLGDEKSNNVKTASYFANYGGRKYVVGILAGRVKDLAEEFKNQGFKMTDITGKAPSSLYLGVSLQRRPSLPLIQVKEFNDPLVDILRQIASTKQ